MAALNDYGFLDRLVHRIAFLSPSIQLAAADIEDKLFARDIEGVTAERPVFITSLPRAGTTIMLSALSSVQGFATHLYRDMPFVMAPLFWSRISRRFGKSSTLQQRAHGDGIEIGYDSPEAFEEVIWRAFWPDHYGADAISLWSEREKDPEARAFLLNHFRKIVAVRSGGGQVQGRYISKNNGNIARLDLIRALFPDATILVPVRAPLAHAASLLQQHRNFLARHRDDPFARRYMGDIGHYEFGLLHRPILFERWKDLSDSLNPKEIDYWLAYWIAAFEHISKRRAHLSLVNYEELCRRNQDTCRQLCDDAGIDPSFADAIGSHFRPPRPLPSEFDGHQSPMRDRAEALFAELFQSGAGHVQSSTVK